MQVTKKKRALFERPVAPLLINNLWSVSCNSPCPSLQLNYSSTR